MGRKVFGDIVRVGKDFCSIFILPFQGAVTTEAGDLIQYFTNLIENTNSMLARTLKYLMWVPSLASSSERMVKHVRINLHKARKNLKRGYQAIPKSSRLQKMNA